MLLFCLQVIIAVLVDGKILEFVVPFFLWFLKVLIVWVPLSILFGLLLGAMIKLADKEQQLPTSVNDMDEVPLDDMMEASDNPSRVSTKRDHEVIQLFDRPIDPGSRGYSDDL